MSGLLVWLLIGVLVWCTDKRKKKHGVLGFMFSVTLGAIDVANYAGSVLTAYWSGWLVNPTL